MKCPACGRQQSAKQGMQCSGCSYKFTFNPKDAGTLGLTDGKFIAAIRTASKNGTVAYTENQLYAAYAAKITSPRTVLMIIGCVVAGVGLVLALTVGVFGVFPLIFGGLIFLASLVARPQVLRRSTFIAAIPRWLAQGKPADGLIVAPALHTAPPDWSEHDIYDYGVERILIVQRELLVDLMVRNHQHAEQRMVVIAESGYPEYLIPHVNRLLEERPDLPVYLLHDGDLAGATMANRVQSLPWLRLGTHPVIDLGVFESDFEKLGSTRGLRNQQSDREFPADALLMGALTTAMAASFVSQTSLADEILREHQNRMSAESSFG